MIKNVTLTRLVAVSFRGKEARYRNIRKYINPVTQKYLDETVRRLLAEGNRVDPSDDINNNCT